MNKRLKKKANKNMYKKLLEARKHGEIATITTQTPIYKNGELVKIVHHNPIIKVVKK